MYIVCALLTSSTLFNVNNETIRSVHITPSTSIFCTYVRLCTQTIIHNMYNYQTSRLAGTINDTYHKHTMGTIPQHHQPNTDINKGIIESYLR